MVHAFVMVETAAGRSEPLIEAIRGLDGITEAHVVAGEFDVIAEVDGDEIYDVLHSVSLEMQHLDGVERTKTYISLN